LVFGLLLVVPQPDDISRIAAWGLLILIMKAALESLL